MVNSNKRSKSKGMGKTVVIGLVFVVILSRQYSKSASLRFDRSHLEFNIHSDEDKREKIAVQNAAEIKRHRTNIQDQCEAATSAAEVQAIREINTNFFSIPSQPVAQPRDDSAVIRCKNIVLDFGANIGDTCGKVIDTGLIGCDRSKDLWASVPAPTFNTKTKQFTEVTKRNELVQGLIGLMNAYGPTAGPEDYCYYGIEGNPVFTKRLQELEDTIMGTTPRPLQRAHFFTESVGTGEDGMTKLFLDTVNTEQNFWGSSIMSNHWDVKKSLDEKGNKVAAPVMGYTLGTLMRKTIKAFDPNASPEDKKGGHFILKVDIEGGEYPLITQAAEEGTLCEYVQMGNKADLFVEFHSEEITGPNPLAGEPMKKALKKLAACGATVQDLPMAWGR